MERSLVQRLAAAQSVEFLLPDQREAAILTHAEHSRFDASDLMPAEMNEAFWQAVLDFTADQSRLPEILEHLDAVRSTAYGD